MRRELDISGNSRLVGRLSGTEPSEQNLNCLIGLHKSWLWLSAFESPDEDGLIRVSADNSELHEQDNVMYLLPWEFQPPIAFLLLDSSTVWDERTFGTGLAASSRFVGEDGKPWRQLRPISAISELTQNETVEVNGWDHEHCSICNKHIVEGDKHFFGAWGEGGSYLCVFCHDRFAKTHSVGEVIYAGFGERISEQD